MFKNFSSNARKFCQLIIKMLEQNKLVCYENGWFRKVIPAHNDLKYEFNSLACIYYAYVINSSYIKKVELKYSMNKIEIINIFQRYYLMKLF